MVSNSVASGKCTHVEQYILEQATNFRCGIVLPYQETKNTFCDVYGYYNISVPNNSTRPWESASGSLNSDKNLAISGAIGEALERYSGAVCHFQTKKISELEGKNILSYGDFSLFSESQYQSKDFKWKRPDIKEALFGEMFSLTTGHGVWIPQELIGLGIKGGTGYLPSTSNGLAAHSHTYKALLSAIHEVLERDALTVYWLNSLGGREIKLDERYTQRVKEKYGEVYCFDITQDWNPHPVVMVCGSLKQRNKKRISLGVACRENYDLAIDKAFNEWIQGCIFTGFYSIYHPDLEIKKGENVDDFDKHALYYTLHPEEWDKVPLIKNRFESQRNPLKENRVQKQVENTLQNLIELLDHAQIRLLYRDLTSPDVRDAGVKVVRVVSPELSMIHADDSAMFLGGRTQDVRWRYKDLPIPLDHFPNIYPHPLG